MTQYLMSVWHDDNYELDFSSDDAQRMVTQVSRFNDDLQASGAWVFGGGLALCFVRTELIDELVVVLLEVVAAGDWSLPASVEARLADGSVRRYAVQAARSTGSATVAAGDQLRLVLVGAVADAGQWVALTVGASTVEL